MKKVITYILILISLVFVACEEDMDVNLNTGENKRLVVDGYITNHPTLDDTVKLSYTTDYFSEEEVPIINDAEVTIKDNEGNFHNLKNVGDGKYIINKNEFTGEAGNTYTLNININEEKYSATCEMKPVVDIDSVTWKYYYVTYTDEYLYTLTYFGQEPPEKGQCYLWNVYLNNKLVTDTLREVIFTSDREVNGEYIKDWDMIWFTEKQLDQNTGIEEDGNMVYPDTINIRIEMLSITQEYYDFMVEVLLETVWRGSLFDGPPANTTTNVSNNAVGFFYAAAITEYEFTLIRSEKEKRLEIY